MQKEKKEELLANYEYQEMRLRKRSVGNIRFIGELYKLRMLTSLIMMRIIQTLLDKADSESLECLCKLLSTIGFLLEPQVNNVSEKCDEFNRHFECMGKIINDKSTPSRVRFLMMDVIDLRKNNWVARREENMPKTKAEVHQEAKREEEQQQFAINQALAHPRRDDRTKRNSRDNRGIADEGWSVAHSSRNNRKETFDSARLKNSTFGKVSGPDSSLTLRGGGYGNWQKGSSGGTGVSGLVLSNDVTSGNKFKVLSSDGMQDDRKLAPQSQHRFAPGGMSVRGTSYGSKSMPPPSSERQEAISCVRQFVGPVSPERSRSTQPKSREASLNREVTSLLKGSEKLSEAEAEKHTTNIIEEFSIILDFKVIKFLHKICFRLELYNMNF